MRKKAILRAVVFAAYCPSIFSILVVSSTMAEALSGDDLVLVLYWWVSFAFPVWALFKRSELRGFMPFVVFSICNAVPHTILSFVIFAFQNAFKDGFVT